MIHQSRRAAHYQAALKSLLDTGWVYPLHAAGKYWPVTRVGGMARPSIREPAAPVASAGSAPALRLRVTDASLTFHDAVQGDYRQQLERRSG
ncbi:MAG: hypothetical protein U1F70_04195 [Candidatus Competibacteraceae bacterium]